MRLFVTGIGTEVGKTIIAAILTEALEADYWKPIQAGDLHHSDTDRVKALVTNNRSIFYKEAFCLQVLRVFFYINMRILNSLSITTIFVVSIDFYNN